MPYKPSEARYDRGGRVLYLVYQSPQRLASGKQQELTRVKRLYFPGDAQAIKLGSPGSVRKRSGRTVHGVEVRYRNRQDGRGRGSTTQRVKVVELPQGTSSLKLTDEPPEGPLQAIA
jgi:hypothetical protein